MNKYTYINNKLKYTPYNHASHIKNSYDEAIRLIVFKDLKLIYIRINNFDKLYYGLEAKRLEYKFKNNLEACISLLKRIYKTYKIYDSYTINDLSYDLQRQILNS